MAEPDGTDAWAPTLVSNRAGLAGPRRADCAALLPAGAAAATAAVTSAAGSAESMASVVVEGGWSLVYGYASRPARSRNPEHHSDRVDLRYSARMGSGGVGDLLVVVSWGFPMRQAGVRCTLWVLGDPSDRGNAVPC